jgi:autophagy-related protein 101
MTAKQFNSDLLDIDQDDLKEVLRCMIHTILFQRALGLIKPKDYHIEILDFYYVQCDHPDLIKRIEERIDAIVSNFVKKPKEVLQVEISFHHKVEKSKQSWFGKNEMVCWEQWFVNLKVGKPAPKTPGT